MKRHWLATSILAVFLPFAGIAGGSAASFRLDSGVAITNTQANSSWAPVAVLVKFDAPATGTLTVRRVSQGVNVVVGSCVFANVSSVVWVPDAAFWFEFGDVLVIRSSATNGVAQLMRRAE